MLREIRDLGFDYAELSHGIRISLLPGIFEAVDAGEIKISSLHNFCPLPMGVDRAANLKFIATLATEIDALETQLHGKLPDDYMAGSISQALEMIASAPTTPNRS